MSWKMINFKHYFNLIYYFFQRTKCSSCYPSGKSQNWFESWCWRFETSWGYWPWCFENGHGFQIKTRSNWSQCQTRGFCLHIFLIIYLFTFWWYIVNCLFTFFRKSILLIWAENFVKRKFNEKLKWVYMRMLSKWHKISL